MLNIDIINEKLNLITRDLERLKIFSNSTFQEIASDFIKFAAIKNILMEIIGRAIDINEHLLSTFLRSEMEVPKTYKGTFVALFDIKVLPKEFANEISKSAGFRNAIVHEYNNISENDIYGTIGEAIQQYTTYSEYILRFCEQVKK